MEICKERKHSWSEMETTENVERHCTLQMDRAHGDQIEMECMPEKPLEFSSLPAVNKQFQLLTENQQKREFAISVHSDRNVCKAAKLVEKYVSSGIMRGASDDTAYVLADFTADFPQLTADQLLMISAPNSPQTSTQNYLEPPDAKTLLKRSVATLLVHNEILICKSSVLQMLSELAQKLIYNIGMHIASETAFGSTRGQMRDDLGAAEIALHSVGIEGIADVIQYYRFHVLQRGDFLDAIVNHACLEEGDKEKQDTSDILAINKIPIH